MSLTDSNPAESPQVAIAEKALELKKKNAKPHNKTAALKAKKREERGLPAVRLLDKWDVLAITNTSYVTVWSWMRAGTFPRSREVRGRSMWLSTEVEAWLAALPLRKLKGDAVGVSDDANAGATA